MQALRGPYTSTRTLCCFWGLSARFCWLRPASRGFSTVHTSQLQRWDQRVREGRAVAAGLVAAQRDVGGEAEASRHLCYNSSRGACERGKQWQRPGAPREPAGRPESFWGAPRQLQEAPGALADGSRTPRSPQAKPTRPEPHDGPRRPQRRPPRTAWTAPRGPNCWFSESFGGFSLFPPLRAKNGPGRPPGASQITPTLFDIHFLAPHVSCIETRRGGICFRYMSCRRVSDRIRTNANVSMDERISRRNSNQDGLRMSPVQRAADESSCV